MRIAWCLAVWAVLAGVAALAAAPQEEMTIRVGLAFGETAPRSVTIRGKGRFQAAESFGSFGGELRVSASERSLVVGRFAEQTEVGPWLELWAAGSDPWLELNSYAYRGRLRLELQPGGGLKIINVVGVEDYVRGVIANEMFADPEGYKVQAVASRTLALYVRDHAPRHLGEGFDVCTEGHCQVYRGVDSESPLVEEAVRLTAGEILTYRGRPIFAAYHANAGGATDAVDEVWPGSIREDFPYLTSTESPFDQEAERLPGYQWCFRWRREVSRPEVAARLAARGQEVGEVKELRILARSRGGRAKVLEIIGTAGKARIMGTAAISQVLGTPSSKLELREEEGRLVAEGQGYGDGVGLSQHGALGMAWAGYGYQEILAWYYPGVSLARDYGRGQATPLARPQVRAPAPP